jgi:hypothetical protein
VWDIEAHAPGGIISLSAPNISVSKSFRDLVAFQFATELMVEVYRVTKSFPREELYGLVSQLRRAAIGVMAQIAEVWDVSHPASGGSF